ELGRQFWIVSNRREGERLVARIPVVRKPRTNNSGARKSCSPWCVVIDHQHLGAQFGQMKRCTRPGDPASHHNDFHQNAASAIPATRSKIRIRQRSNFLARTRENRLTGKADLRCANECHSSILNSTPSPTVPFSAGQSSPLE